jgi:hypothetical protein
MALNILCHFRNLLHVSDIAKCKGISLNKFVVLNLVEELVMYVFPREEPTQSNHRLWEEAIARLCNGSLSLPYTLGQYVQPPHHPLNWFTTHLSEALYRVQKDPPNTLYNVYHLREDRVSTQHGQQYKWTGLATRTYPGIHYASVTMRSPIVAVLHSQAPFPPHPPSPTTL